jgi:hypothetical protein
LGAAHAGRAHVGERDLLRAGEVGHAPLKRGQCEQAIVLSASRMGDQVSRVAALATKRGKSVDFTGYWQRHVS